MVWLEPGKNVTKKQKKLLAEAGYTADKPLTINLLYNTSDLHKKAGDCSLFIVEEKHWCKRQTG